MGIDYMKYMNVYIQYIYIYIYNYTETNLNIIAIFQWCNRDVIYCISLMPIVASK